MSSCYTNIAFNNLFILFHISYSNDRVYKLPNLQVTPLREISKHRASVTSEIPRKRERIDLGKTNYRQGSAAAAGVHPTSNFPPTLSSNSRASLREESVETRTGDENQTGRKSWPERETGPIVLPIRNTRPYCARCNFCFLLFLRFVYI